MLAHRQNRNNSLNWCGTPSRNRWAVFRATGSADWRECFRLWCLDGWPRVGGMPELFRQLAEEMFAPLPPLEIPSPWWNQRGPCIWEASPWSGCRSPDVRRSPIVGRRLAPKRLSVGGRSREERIDLRTEMIWKFIFSVLTVKRSYFAGYKNNLRL